MENEEGVQLRLQQLQKQLGKKQMFEESVSAIRSLFNEKYPSASSSLRKALCSVVCRVCTILKTRYTSPGLWSAGLDLFLDAQRLVVDDTWRKHLQKCIDEAVDQLNEAQNAPDSMGTRDRRGYLFEGHLTVDPEPPQPGWLVQSELLASAAGLADLLHGESSGEQIGSTDSVASNHFQDLISRLNDIVPEFPEVDAGVPRAPPASKEVVEKLPIKRVTGEMLRKLGKDAVCSICQEVLVMDDEMQELPCNHMFHPPCLKPWLDEHNSCPICRHELKTDDHAYESWKEREREADEDRKGAANAVRGGEYMYV